MHDREMGRQNVMISGLPPMAPRKPSTDSDPFLLVGSSSSHHAPCSSYIPKPLSLGDWSRASSSRNNTVTRRKRGVDGISRTPHDHASSSSSSSSSSASASSLTDEVDVGLLSQRNPGSLNLSDGGPSSLLAGPTPAPNNNEEERKLRRTLSNRVSAQRSRERKFQYMVDLERRASTLEANIAFITPQLEFYRNRMSLLLMEQKSLSYRLAACANKKLLMEAEIVEKKAEMHRLRVVQLKQQQDALADMRKAADHHQAAPALGGPNLELTLPGPSCLYASRNPAAQ